MEGVIPRRSAARAVVVSAPAAPRVAAQASERNLGLDTARVGAALGTVWIHSVQSEEMAPWGEVGRFAVPFFAVTAAILLVEALYANPQRGFASYVGQRAKRLYAPFALWTVVYLVARAVKHAVLHTGEPIVYLPSIALNGSAHHLWFLPALALWTIVGFPVVKWALHHRGWSKSAAIALFMIAALWARLYSPPTEVAPGVVGLGHWKVAYDALFTLDPGLPYFVDQNLRRFPCFLAGIAIALFFGPLQRLRDGIQTTSAWSGVLCTAACMLEVAAIGRNSLLAMLAGIGWTIAAYGRWSPVWVVRVVGPLGRLSFGVYLVHVLLCEGIQAVGKRAGVPDTWWFDLVIFAASAGGSFALVWGLRRFAATRWMVPG